MNHLTCEAANHYYHVTVALLASLCAGLALGSAIWCWVMFKRCQEAQKGAERLLDQALADRLGMDEKFIERMKREFLGGDKPKEKPKTS